MADPSGHGVTREARLITADHANLALAGVVALLGGVVVATGNLVLALLAGAVAAMLTGLATYTAITPHPEPAKVTGLAAVAAVVATVLFVVIMEGPWALVVPVVALASGLATARARGARLAALVVMLAVMTVFALTA